MPKKPIEVEARPQMKLLPAAKKKHLESGGLAGCPFCHDEDSVDYGELEPVENGNVEQITKCVKCGCKWKDIFKLVDVQIIS